MCVNEIWCSICCRYMDGGCRDCKHFDKQMHLDAEDKVDTKMTNFDKLLEDPENRKAIIAVVSRKFCINKNSMTVHNHVHCDGCGFYAEGTNCDDVIFDWLQEEYIEGGEE